MRLLMTPRCSACADRWAWPDPTATPAGEDPGHCSPSNCSG
ncbi:hypothetical protein [Synechococcus sp. BA-132 BA5]|nr:hypothetical protein [Synechococcus sp. BA-132 BA5]